MKIDWGHLPTYNTIMAIAAGSALILLARLGSDVAKRHEEISMDGYALSFGVLGFILTTTGLHMTLTWPLAPEFPFDNIVFGETSLGFGVLLLAAGFYIWKRGTSLLAAPSPIERMIVVARPISVFVAALGLALIAIGAAGMRYRLFAAPPQEPISGWYFAKYPWVEATFISGLWALVGVGALGFFAAVNMSRRWFVVPRVAWLLSGIAFVLFGALNFFTHIGLIVETM